MKLDVCPNLQGQLNCLDALHLMHTAPIVSMPLMMQVCPVADRLDRVSKHPGVHTDMLCSGETSRTAAQWPRDPADL